LHDTAILVIFIDLDLTTSSSLHKPFQKRKGKTFLFLSIWVGLQLSCFWF